MAGRALCSTRKASGLSGQSQAIQQKKILGNPRMSFALDKQFRVEYKEGGQSRPHYTIPLLPL